ncbi:MAG: 30S ribosomal protein S12 methylthiotransferase RimO [Syntrophomonas sp.]
MNIGFVSLGCPKNRVDTEIMMASLKYAGHRIVNSMENADAVIINTCGFITSAQEEAIDKIIETGKRKEKGQLKYLIAAGCLSQKYGSELLAEMPELDGAIGISFISSLPDVLERVAKGEKVVLTGPPPDVFVEKGPRLLTTPPGSAYLKISEGCNNRCSYCSIPSIRGNLRSRPLEELVQEAEILTNSGVKELVIIGQDTAAYGQDLYGQSYLTELVKKISNIKGLKWIRLMYLHPAHIDEQLINIIAAEPKIVPYLDIPIQHASNRILKLMNRKHEIAELKRLVAELRSRLKGLVLRTTVMVGFPGESEDDFSALYDFVGETQFDWLGSFTYSAQEGTAAATMIQEIPEHIKKERNDQILRLQQKISRKKNIARINTSEKILISSRLSKNLYAGRGYYQAPEVDGITLVKIRSGSKLPRGEFVDVHLIGVRNYDMIGELIDESAK